MLLRYKKNQWLFSLLAILIVSGVSYLVKDVIGYKGVALILLLLVSLLAILFELKVTLAAAAVTALVWNFFFIPPLFTFHIGNTDDNILFLMYFVIASVGAVLSNKIKKQEKEIVKRQNEEKTLTLYNTLFNSLSHELKTPLSTIMGAVDILKDPKAKVDAANRDLLVEEIKIASDRLNRQVSNLLHMSRIDSGELKPALDWTDVNEIIYLLIEKEEVNNERIVFTGNDELPLFKLDAFFLENALFNLVHNALIYTPETGKVFIDVECDESELIIHIQDEGMGFTTEQRGLVFKKFYRIPSTKPGGTGLGLSIVKGFIESMKGSVHLQNRKEGGAHFMLRIPCEMSYLSRMKNE